MDCPGTKKKKGGKSPFMGGPVKDCMVQRTMVWSWCCIVGERKWTGQALKLTTLAPTILAPEMGVASRNRGQKWCSKAQEERRQSGTSALCCLSFSAAQQEQKMKRLCVSVLQLSQGPWHPSLTNPGPDTPTPPLALRSVRGYNSAGQVGMAQIWTPIHIFGLPRMLACN